MILDRFRVMTGIRFYKKERKDMRKILFLFGFLVCFISSTVYGEDLNGTWDLKMYGPHGEEEMVLVIQNSGKEMLITGNHPALGDIEGTGTLKGNEVSMRTDPAGPKEISLEFIGKVRGDKMSGTKELKMYGDGSIQVVHDDDGTSTAVGHDPDIPSTMDPTSETWSNEWTAERR